MLSVKLRRRLKTTYKNSTFFDFLFPLKSYQLFGTEKFSLLYGYLAT